MEAHQEKVPALWADASLKAAWCVERKRKGHFLYFCDTGSWVKLVFVGYFWVTQQHFVCLISSS